MSKQKSNTINIRQFGSSLSGSYKAPYKSEPLVKGLIIGVFAALVVVILLIAIKVISDNITLLDGSDMLYIVAVSLICVFAEAIVITLAIILVKVLRSGYKCTYIEDGERFVTNEGGNSREFYYWEVKDIHFVPKEVFGKVRGYEVTVVLESRQEVYAVVSDGFLSKESTPFYIVVERVEAYRKKKSREAYIKEMRSLNNDVLSFTDTGTDNAANRLGRDAEMPTVILPRTADESSISSND